MSKKNEYQYRPVDREVRRCDECIHSRLNERKGDKYICMHVNGKDWIEMSGKRIPKWCPLGLYKSLKKKK